LVFSGGFSGIEEDRMSEFESFTLEHDYSPRRGRLLSFLTSAGITASLGVGLAVMAIVFFRASKAEPMVIEKPVVHYKEKPAPPPQIIYKEVENPVPLTPVMAIAEPISWEGPWVHSSGRLPMFNLQLSRGTIMGTYAPNWSKVLHFQGGRITEDGVEFVVDDSLYRVHFRVKMLNAKAMSVTAWITDSDWLISLGRANNMQLTQQQAVMIRREMEEGAKMRKPKSLGTFIRGTGD
jgi:hypothetical protein